MIEPFTWFLWSGFAFVIAMFYIVLRMARASGDTNKERLATRAEIGRRAAAKGRSFEAGRNLAAWTVRGTLPGGEAWTLAYSVARDSDPSTADRIDWLEGQQLEWRCPALEREARVFSFFSGTGEQKRAALGRLPAEKEIWQRWRLEFRDGPNEAIARRAFGPATCALLARLPSGMNFSRHIDRRTSMTCGGDGLVAVLGVDELTAELVDLWIEIAETVASGLQP